jgi:hypothetical protein
MRRCLLVALVALAGCGHGDAAKRTAPVKEAGKRAARKADQALERVRRSDLPDDAKKELEEAKKLLDAQD